MLKKPNDLKKFQEDACKNCSLHWAAVEACVDAWDAAQGCYIEWQELLLPSFNVVGSLMPDYRKGMATPAPHEFEDRQFDTE